METWTLQFADSYAITFKGELIAYAASSPDTSDDRYSGYPGAWFEISLYRTASGHYVCHRKACALSGDEYCRGKVCVDVTDVQAFFGLDELAEELYAKAGLLDAEGSYYQKS